MILVVMAPQEQFRQGVMIYLYESWQSGACHKTYKPIPDKTEFIVICEDYVRES